MFADVIFILVTYEIVKSENDIALIHLTNAVTKHLSIYTTTASFYLLVSSYGIYSTRTKIHSM